MSQCPCKSNRPYAQCCEPIHADQSRAKTPEQMMRARYCAHTLNLVDFVVDTYHPSCDAEHEREGIAESIDSDWCNLEVLETSINTDNTEGFVTFNAYFNENGEQYCLAEKSRFVLESGLWYYIDGEFPEGAPAEDEPVVAAVDPRLNQAVSELKVGRNDPCICGSGKKFKKCCG
ncbi:YchJ family protein [Vibrio tapetis]|uniref:YchJ-like middle NTF2-like domain-containing protein n=1 Tax=Vibrio tapetis subsp. tapetis TaxID=1671868 RepID=A0A2N8ZAT5_9VIBR|nr:YchJ family protein [Vibrio tapetis]SON49011.1 conserved hypothetical protein [Vibrio tapetis subsp. tapetis]